MNETKAIELHGIKLFSDKKVYFPREDSELLAECIKVFPKAKALDLGCGTGFLGLIAAKQKAIVYCADINPVALSLTEKNAIENKLEITVIESNLFSNIKEKFDFIYFNPPYVEGKASESGWIDKAVDGGKKGREIIDKFIPEIKNHLTENGKCFFLQSDLNKIKKTEKKLEENALKYAVEKRKKIFFEELIVFKAWK
ncbi:MAG: HemK2/MTQ2 family protein methyltransferase [archaeon]